MRTILRIWIVLSVWLTALIIGVALSGLFLRTIIMIPFCYICVLITSKMIKNKF